MAGERMKIKDLAAELSLTEVEVKSAAREILKVGGGNKNIATVSLADAEKLRSYFKERRETSDKAKKQDVIVRRRRDKSHDSSDLGKKDKDAPKDASAAKESSKEAPKDGSKEGGKDSKDTPKEGSERRREGRRNRQDQSRRPEERRARIIASPAPEQKARVIRLPNQEPPKDADKAADKPAAEVPPTSPGKASEAPAAKIVSPKPEGPTQDKAVVIKPEAAQAKIVQKAESKDAGEPKPSQESTAIIEAKAEDVAAKPKADAQPSLEASVEAPKAVDEVKEESAQAEKKESKDGKDSKDAKDSKEGKDGKDTKEGKSKDRDKDKDSERKGKDKFERIEPEKESTPKVRIISRPTPQPQAATKKEDRGESKHTRGEKGSGNRSGGSGNRQGRGQRSGGGGGGGFRQQQNVPMPDIQEAQSKKKRLKRRTVDFQQGDFGQNDDDEVPRMNRSRGKRKPNRQQPRQQQVVTQPIKAAKRKVKIVEFITVAEMAKQMGLKATELIKVLFQSFGKMATINQSLDYDEAALLAQEFDYEVERTGFSEDDYLVNKVADAPESLKPRPPVVTIMGHVDHGKTSLLDAIRKSHVTSGEAGGITQHIGAYHVKTKRGDIVFLDTPGHEAFTAMRARGAQITDLVILVVAADDGVMEQTREAINHSKAANVPIMVAVNKMDKPGADPDRVLRELAELGLQPEDWGGDTIVAKVSAKTREGLDDLLEMVALQAEIMELKANPDKNARGHIVEARLDKGRGPVATVLIQEGTLHHGDNFVCGQFSGRVRSLLNDQGKKVKEAGPSIPVEVQGVEGVPEAGEEFVVVQDEKLARRIADARAAKQRERELAKESKVTLETFLSQVGDKETMTLNLVVKADVQGSLEAITEAVNKLSTDKVVVHVVHGGAGAISESDILLASASKAIIIGFNVRPTSKIKEVAERENVDIRFYNIIYKLVEDIKSAMQGLLAPVQREVYLGQAEVRETFNLPKVGTIAGCYVADGKIQRNAGVRLLRDGVVVYTGKIVSLKRFKDDAKEVVKGNECGAGLENFNDIKIGDIIEAFETIEEAAKL
ncbi:MAG: translation initiation factor IF-2 [Desulfovibrionaceae bacterium]|nr:translation initiation factor IF-2 [Desulfovibrionaceae bacterium]